MCEFPKSILRNPAKSIDLWDFLCLICLFCPLEATMVLQKSHRRNYKFWKSSWRFSKLSEPISAQWGQYVCVMVCPNNTARQFTWWGYRLILFLDGADELSEHLSILPVTQLLQQPFTVGFLLICLELTGSLVLSLSAPFLSLTFTLILFLFDPVGCFNQANYEVIQLIINQLILSV